MKSAPFWGQYFQIMFFFCVDCDIFLKILLEFVPKDLMNNKKHSLG